MLSAYVHDLDPILISFTENIAIRWYGLAYLGGFVAGWWILKTMAEKKLFPLAPEKTSDFIAYAAFLGVFLGGRFGYVLFYMLPSPDGREQIMDDPLTIFKVWDGGMSSHGGIIGLTIFAWFYARKHKLSWRAIGDGLVCVAPLGVFFGRIANYINGELYGHIAKGDLPWLVQFPSTLFNPKCAESEKENYNEAMGAAIQASSGKSHDALVQAYTSGLGGEATLTAAIRENPDVAEAIEPYLSARHPSQLYEGVLEGLLLFIILLALRFRYPKLPLGMLTGLFFLLYAIGRIFVEQYRVPDSAMVLGLTKGQFYSTFFIIVGVGFLGAALRKKTSQPTPAK